MTHKEAKFDINELFFSITDHESRILSGNDVFVRVSEYTREELIGKYHNVIRHPDMPKVVFKTLWDHLKADKAVVAYVKNRTKSGAFYWVLAAVFPVGDRYVSIRIKPSTTLFASARELYFKLLMAESKGGMEESERSLPGMLNALGYEDYDHYMGDALLSELKGRENILHKSVSDVEQGRGNSAQGAKLLPMCQNIKTLMRSYDRWFEKVDLFGRMKTMFEEKGDALRQHARDIVFLSLNASVASYRVENGGETFGILARDIRTNAKENDLLISDIYTALHRLSEALNSMVFTVASIHLQFAMTGYFIAGMLHKSAEIDLLEVQENMQVLAELVAAYTKQLSGLQQEIEKEIKESLKRLRELEQQVMYLGYIQIYGIIEAAAEKDEKAGFGGIFSQLKTLIAQTSEEIRTMQTMAQEFDRENYALASDSQDTEKVIERLKQEIRYLGEGK